MYRTLHPSPHPDGSACRAIKWQGFFPKTMVLRGCWLLPKVKATLCSKLQLDANRVYLGAYARILCPWQKEWQTSQRKYQVLTNCVRGNRQLEAKTCKLFAAARVFPAMRLGAIKPILLKSARTAAIRTSQTPLRVVMGVTVETVKPGDGVNFPKKGNVRPFFDQLSWSSLPL